MRELPSAPSEAWRKLRNRVANARYPQPSNNDVRLKLSQLGNKLWKQPPTTSASLGVRPHTAWPQLKSHLQNAHCDLLSTDNILLKVLRILFCNLEYLLHSIESYTKQTQEKYSAMLRNNETQHSRDALDYTIWHTATSWSCDRYS